MSKTSKTKKKVLEVMNQAKDSLRILEALEKETLAKARAFVKLPVTDERIVARLKKIGIATQAEVVGLENRLAAVEGELKSLKEAAPKKAARAPQASASAPEASPSA